MEWYYVSKSKEQVGPLSEADFQKNCKAGKIKSNTLVWNQSMKNWQKFSDVMGTGSEQAVDTPERNQASACSECGQAFPMEEMIRYEDSWVCANCKPVFVQKIKEGVSVAGAMEYAGFWIRVGAKIIDSIIIGIINFAFVFVMGLLLASTAMAEDPSLAVSVAVINQLIGLALGAGYSSWFLGKFSATPGKMACGLKVVTSEKQQVSYLRGFGRYFAEMLSSIILCIGYFMVAFDSEKRGLHDRICNTRVIKK